MKVNPSHAFMRERGVSTEIAERHGIGYCNRGMMKGRIWFPLRAACGQLVGYSGWSVETGEDLSEDVARYKLPKGFQKQQVLYNYDRMLSHIGNGVGGKHVVIVEGFWSAMKFDEAGIPTVACMGSSLSQAQIKLLVDAAVEYITVIFDGDDAGHSGQAKALFDLSKESLWVSAVHLYENQSPDQLTDDQIKLILTGINLPQKEPLKKAS